MRGVLDVKRQPTLLFNGYADEVASLYRGMNLRENLVRFTVKQIVWLKVLLHLAGFAAGLVILGRAPGLL